jgi:hypothetical protein
LTRYHGVFAARSSWRALVTPKPPDGVVRRKAEKPCKKQEPAAEKPLAAKPQPPPRPSAASEPSLTPSVLAIQEDPTVITVRHWGRLLEGELYALSSRLEGSVLLKRTHGINALACPKCEGKLRPIATITDDGAVCKILRHLGLRTEPLPRARARDPTGQVGFDFHVA